MISCWRCRQVTTAPHPHRIFTPRRGSEFRRTPSIAPHFPASTRFPTVQCSLNLLKRPAPQRTAECLPFFLHLQNFVPARFCQKSLHRLSRRAILFAEILVQIRWEKIPLAPDNRPARTISSFPRVRPSFVRLRIGGQHIKTVWPIRAQHDHRARAIHGLLFAPAQTPSNHAPRIVMQRQVRAWITSPHPLLDSVRGWLAALPLPSPPRFRDPSTSKPPKCCVPCAAVLRNSSSVLPTCFLSVWPAAFFIARQVVTIRHSGAGGASPGGAAPLFAAGAGRSSLSASRKLQQRRRAQHQRQPMTQPRGSHSSSHSFLCQRLILRSAAAQPSIRNPFVSRTVLPVVTPPNRMLF